MASFKNKIFECIFEKYKNTLSNILNQKSGYLFPILMRLQIFAKVPCAAVKNDESVEKFI